MVGDESTGLEIVRSSLLLEGDPLFGSGVWLVFLDAVAKLGIFFFSFLTGDVSIGLDSARAIPRCGGGGRDLRLELFFFGVVAGGFDFLDDFASVPSVAFLVASSF